ncbi:MAG TPA: pyridoxine 5'-phosphate synthase [Opitutales bacterium]|jgi:pyridoxine 5-phosphate synthase|nr:pyridoxine 5'-phosphate synthase [Opitutales bacterium]
MRQTPLLLGLNIDHAATLREARYRQFARDCGQMVEPDPVALALCAERAGADGITLHLREDRRHIQEGDVRRLRECVQTRLNLEMSCTPQMVAFAHQIQPEFACLVPENREEVTTEGGLDVIGQRARVAEAVRALLAAGIKTSLFIDPEPEALEVAAEIGSPIVELHTGAFAHSYYGPGRAAELEKLHRAAELGHELGLIVNAGHGINYINIAEVRNLPWLHELNIGHSIICRALFTGISEAVREMKARMHGTI